jgi:ABC-type multidrug transport system fused ATPase/permease subunit
MLAGTIDTPRQEHYNGAQPLSVGQARKEQRAVACGDVRMNVLARLLRFLLPHWKMLVAGVLFILTTAAFSLVPPLLQRQVIDGVIQQQNLSLLGPIIAALVLVYVVIAVCSVGDMYVRHALGARVIVDFRVKVYAYLQRLSLSFFDRMPTGEIMSRVTNDVNEVEQFVTHGTAQLVADLLRLLGGAVILFALDWRLALVVLIPIPFLVVGLRSYNTRIRPVYRRARDRLGDINAVLQDRLSGMRVIQAFAQEDRELVSFSNANERYYDAQVSGIRYMSYFFPSMRLMVLMGQTLLLAVGAVLVVKGGLTLGTLVAFMAYAASFYDPISRLTDVDNLFQRAVAAATRVFELFDTPPDISDATDAISPDRPMGTISFEHVSFSYANNEQVLHDISFHIEPGEVVALVGPSGAGKTSIANLLCRFYDPDSGDIMIDGHDLRSVRLEWLRRHQATVLQDTFLFNSTVRDNLVYARPETSTDDMIAAARAANAHDFVMELSKGYDTEVGERGVRLSGGQKQRLALARAIIADPRILILDEATSSVDAEAEFLIQQALEQVMKGRTALVIAHRLSTIRRADRIIALEDGHIREVGNHQELIQAGGLYSQLYRRQLETYAEPD